MTTIEAFEAGPRSVGVRAGTRMGPAVLVSAAIHAALLGAGYLALQMRPPMEIGSIDSISVEIISLEEFGDNAPEAVESDASEALVAAGAAAVEAVETETAEAVEAEVVTEAVGAPVTEPIEVAAATSAEVVETVKPIEVATAVLPVDAEPMRAETAIAAVEALAVPEVEAIGAPVLTAVLAPLMPVELIAPETSEVSASVVAAVFEVTTAKPVQSAMLEAVVEEEVTVAPVPKVRTVEQTTTPTYPEAKDAPKKRQAAVEPKAQPEPQEEQPKKKRQAAAGGAGGADEADSAASAQSGGKGASSAASKAATDKYPSQVQARLRKALRFPKNAKGAEGEVHVRFVVAANGRASQISVVRSSGSPVIDDAAIATVKRAAPFPPIPEGAGKSSWTFTMPLLFQK